MILTPIALPDLPAALARFDAALDAEPVAQAVFRRIADTLAVAPDDSLALSQDPAHHAEAVALALSFGMGIVDASPTTGFTWDGHALRVRMEPSVIIHDVAHLQVCAPERRTVPDFGLGAGPETGLRAEADAAMGVFGVAREMEEALTSLLGILWEVELGQPALCAFLEQNWLEGGASPANLAHFLKILGHLHTHGLVDDDGRPTRALRETGDDIFLAPFTKP
jgi:hypothetical protein